MLYVYNTSRACSANLFMLTKKYKPKPGLNNLPIIHLKQICYTVFKPEESKNKPFQGYEQQKTEVNDLNGEGPVQG